MPRAPSALHLLALSAFTCGCEEPASVDAPPTGSGWSDPGGGEPEASVTQRNQGPRPWRFVEVARASGFDYEVHFTPTEATARTQFASQLLIAVSGVAAGDYDGDGLPDLYAVRGDTGSDLLFHNRGDGTFE